MTSKNVVADLIKGEKVDGTNSDMWNKKIQYIFNEQEVLETFTTAMEPPEEENTTQHGPTNKFMMFGLRRIFVHILSCLSACT